MSRIKLRKLFSGGGYMQFIHIFTDQELARLLDLVSMSDDDFFLRFPDVYDHNTSVPIPDPVPEER